jgi:hypothetical protein
MFYKKNRAKCLNCGDLVESESITEWSECSCCSLRIRGGSAFLERDGKPNSFKELSIVEFPKEISFREDVTSIFPPADPTAKNKKK